jgi:toxin YoeB
MIKNGRERFSVFHTEFIEDLEYWVGTDRNIAIKILRFSRQILRDPFKGLGKPEPLKHIGTGVWSRRITQEHRLVYLVQAERIDFLQCRYHY